MQAPEPNTSERSGDPIAGNEVESFRTLLDLCPFPALLVAAESGNVVLANEAARRLHLPPSDERDDAGDYQARDSQGAALDSRLLLQHLLSRACAAEGVEIDWRTPHQPFCFRVCARTRPARENRPALTLLTFVDITSQKAAERELRHTLEARDEFFAIAAHELKDPLFALQLSLQFLRYSAQRLGDMPAHVAQHLEVSERQAERLGRLIENLLDVSRIANNRLQLDEEAFDLCEVAREMTERFQPKARSLGTTLQAEECPAVIGYFDRLKMEQVIGNLLSNALKYGAARPVTVRVRAEDDRAVLEVEDRGIGIAPQDQERIFDRFQRASEGHKKESLGLGLYITRALVEAHGGTIAVRSELGQGTTFLVTLPRNRQQSNEQPSDEAERREK